MARTSFLLHAVRRGGHTHVSVRAGPEGHDRALAGSLILETEEWLRLRCLLSPHSSDAVLEVLEEAEG